MLRFVFTIGLCFLLGLISLSDCTDTSNDLDKAKYNTIDDNGHMVEHPKPGATVKNSDMFGHRHTRHPITIVADGTFPVKKSDIAIVFYLTTLNQGSVPIEIDIKMHMCCLIINSREKDVDCDSMHLLGGHRGQIMPRNRHNITLVYPNMYPHDRAGWCDIDVIYNDINWIRHRLKFNSTHVPEAAWLPSFIKAYLAYDFVNCDSYDEDRLRGCEPVNCALKYNGHRNFFNQTSRRCEPVPRCISDPHKSLPDKGYNEETNSCIDLNTKLTADDLVQMNNTVETYLWKKVEMAKLGNVECVNGKMSEDEQSCECTEGWTTAPATQTTYDIADNKFIMCNIRIEAHYAYWHRRPLFLLSLFLTLVLIALIVTVGYLCTKQSDDKRTLFERLFVWPKGSKGARCIGSKCCYTVKGEVDKGNQKQKEDLPVEEDEELEEEEEEPTKPEAHDLEGFTEKSSATDTRKNTNQSARKSSTKGLNNNALYRQEKSKARKGIQTHKFSPERKLKYQNRNMNSNPDADSTESCESLINTYIRAAAMNTLNELSEEESN